MDATLQSLAHWIDTSPTPFHVVATAASVLRDHAFSGVSSLDGSLPARGFLALDGALLAWRLGSDDARIRVIGAHTDSPNLRVQPSPDFLSHGWAQLGVEIYGGVLLNSWLDRDLGVAGRVVTAEGEVVPFAVYEAIARIPQLAIHLDRAVNEGLVLDKQLHMMPVWGRSTASFTEWLQSVTGRHNVVSFDAHLFDLTPGRVLGVDGSMYASARLDNQLSCWAAVHALCGIPDGEHDMIVVLNDHEEVGSESATGAAGPLLERFVSVLQQHRRLSAGAMHDRLTGSWCLSADNAHAIHPNYADRHEPRHAPQPNRGPALKINGNQRYATSSRGAAHIRTVADKAGVPLQTFVSRNNVPCGSTIGPIAATRLGIEAIDIGVPQLSMHSAREMCGADDPGHLLTLAATFLQS